MGHRVRLRIVSLLRREFAGPWALLFRLFLSLVSSPIILGPHFCRGKTAPCFGKRRVPSTRAQRGHQGHEKDKPSLALWGGLYPAGDRK